jgi:hypothetical protein
VPSDKKTPHVLHHMGIDRPVYLLAGSVAEVAIPAAQDRVQPIPYVRPGPVLGCLEMIANFLLEPGYCRATIKVRLSVNQGETAPCAV